MDARTALSLHEKLQETKHTVANRLQEVTDLILVSRSNVVTKTSPGINRSQHIYSSEAPTSAFILASTIGSSITPQQAKWFGLTTDNDDTKTRQWLDEVRDIMLAEMEISGFYQSVDELFLELVGYGTSSMFIGERDNSFYAKVWPISEYAIAESELGVIDTVTRQFTLPAKRAVESFTTLPGFKGFGPKLTKAAESDKPSRNMQKFTFVHVIMPNPDHDPDKEKRPDKRPYLSVYVCKDDNHVIAHGGYYEMPVMIPRWRKASDDAGWGRGPGMMVLDDVRLLNEAIRIMHKAALRDLEPPIRADDNAVVGSINLHPRGITYIRRGAQFDYLLPGSRPDLAQLDLNILRQNVRHAFHIDQIQLPPADKNTYMTATEIQVRMELMQRLLGPTLGRLQREFLDPVIKRIFGILFRAGRLPDPPDTIQGKIVVNYESPMARAQKSEEVASIERTMQAAGGMMQLTGDQSIFDNIDLDAALRDIAELFGASPKILRDEDKVKQIREQRQKMMEVMNAMAQAAGGAGPQPGMGDVAGGPGQGVPQAPGLQRPPSG